MDQLPTLEGMLSFSKEKDMWEFNGKWAMGKLNGTAAGFHFTNKTNPGTADSPDGNYSGFFMLQDHQEEDNMYLSFIKNDGNTRQVTGRGWNQFGSFTLDGQYDADGNVILRKYYEEKSAATAFANMTLEDLQTLAAQLHVPAPSRLKQFKKTWMQAINEHRARTMLPRGVDKQSVSESLDAQPKANNASTASHVACDSPANGSVAHCQTSYTKTEEHMTPTPKLKQEAIKPKTESVAKAATPPSVHEVASRSDPKLLAFQKNARRRLLNCALEQQGALLKGAVGSGKTVTMLSVALELLLRDEEAVERRHPGMPAETSEHRVRPILIISPVAVMRHWYAELDLAVSVLINSISHPGETSMTAEISEAQEIAMARATRLKDSLKKSAKLFHGAAREDSCDPSTDRLWITSAETILSEHKRFGKASDVREFCLRGAVVIMDEVHIYRSGSKELVAQGTLEEALVKPLKRYQAATALVVQPVLGGLSEEKDDVTADLGDVATRRDLGAHGALLAATATPMVNSALDLLGLAHWFSLSRVCPHWKKRRLRAAQVWKLGDEAGEKWSEVKRIFVGSYVCNMRSPRYPRFEETEIIFQPNKEELDAYRKQHARVITAMGVYFNAHNAFLRTRNRGCLAEVHLTKNRYRSQIVRLLRSNIHPIFGDLPIIPKDQHELARRRSLLEQAGRENPSCRLKQIWSSIKTHIGCDRVLVFSPFKEPHMVLAAYLRSQGARVWTYFGGVQSNPETLQEFRSLPLSPPKDGIPVPHVLLATMCLGVGVNIPECRNVMWIAGGPMSSSLKRQADGRVRRPLVQKIHQWRSFTFHARNGKHGRTSDDWARDVRLMKSIAMRPLVEMINACVEEDGLGLDERLKLMEPPTDSETEGAWKNVRVANVKVQAPAYTSIAYYNGEDLEAQATNRRQAYAAAVASQMKPTKEEKEMEETLVTEKKKQREAGLGSRKILIRLPTYKPKKATTNQPNIPKPKHDTEVDIEPPTRASIAQPQPKRCKRVISKFSSKFSRPLAWAQIRRYEGSCRHGCLEGQCTHTICLHGLRKHLCRQCRGKMGKKRKEKQRKSARTRPLKRRAPQKSAIKNTTTSPTKRKKSRPEYVAPSAPKESARAIRAQKRATTVATSLPVITKTTTTPTPSVSEASPEDNGYRRLRGAISADLAAMVRSNVLTFEQAKAMMSGGAGEASREHWVEVDATNGVDGDSNAECEDIYEGLSSDLVELVKARELTLDQARSMQPPATPAPKVDLTELEAMPTESEPKMQAHGTTPSVHGRSDIKEEESSAVKEIDVIKRWGWSSN